MNHIPREDAVITAIRRRAKRYGGLVVRKNHGSAFGVKGDPDLYGSYKGRAFSIEVKRPGEDATPLQQARLREWAEAGAVTGTAHSPDEFFRLILGAEETEER